MLQPWDIMNLGTADFGSVCVKSPPVWVGSLHIADIRTLGQASTCLCLQHITTRLQQIADIRTLGEICTCRWFDM